MPLSKHYFITAPGHRQTADDVADAENEFGQATNLMMEYMCNVDKNLSKFSAAEFWMFATKRNKDGDWVLANDHYQQYLQTGEVPVYDGPDANMDEHKDIFIHCQKINAEYKGPVHIDRITVEEGEEISFVYDGLYTIEKFIDGELVFSTVSPAERQRREQNANERPSEAFAKFQEKCADYKQRGNTDQADEKAK